MEYKFGGGVHTRCIQSPFEMSPRLKILEETFSRIANLGIDCEWGCREMAFKRFFSIKRPQYVFWLVERGEHGRAVYTGEGSFVRSTQIMLEICTRHLVNPWNA